MEEEVGNVTKCERHSNHSALLALNIGEGGCEPRNSRDPWELRIVLD